MRIRICYQRYGSAAPDPYPKCYGSGTQRNVPGARVLLLAVIIAVHIDLEDPLDFVILGRHHLGRLPFRRHLIPDLGQLLLGPGLAIKNPPKKNPK